MLEVRHVFNLKTFRFSFINADIPFSFSFINADIPFCFSLINVDIPFSFSFITADSPSRREFRWRNLLMAVKS